MDIPEADAKTVAPSDIAVMIDKNGKMTLNGKQTYMKNLPSQINALVAKSSNRKNATITIICEKTVPWSKAQEIVKIASDLNVKAIIGTKPPK